MSAKKRSFLCKIVHKLTENARFFAQKPHFLHIFAGGRDDFLAGPKTGFLGVRGVARAAPPKTEFCFENSPPTVAMAASQHSTTKKVKEINFFRQVSVFHTHR